MSDIKSKTVNGIIWNGLDRFSLLIIQLSCTLVIARFLTPSDFGIVGMLNVFSALGTILIDSGFSQALIRKHDASTTDYTSIFYFNIFIGCLVYLILFISSPYIAKYYLIPELDSISKILYLVLPINSLALIQTTILQKGMNFKLLSKISIISATLSGLLGIGLSYSLKNVWALVIQTLSYHILRVLLLWVSTDWKPSKKISLSPIIEMAPFSFNLLLSGSISVLFDNMYIILIGKYYRLIDLGLYTQSKKLAEIPSINLTAIIQLVTYSSMSIYQNDTDKLKENYIKIIQISAYIITPTMSFLIITAPLIFDIILGDKWKDSVLFFQLLCFIGILYPLSSISLNILKVTGNSKTLLYLEIVKKISLVAILIFTINLNLTAIIYGNIFYIIIAVFLNLYYCGKKIQLSISNQLFGILPTYLLSTFISTLIFYTINHNACINNIYTLFTAFLTFIVMWVILSYLLRLKAFDDLLKIIK